VKSCEITKILEQGAFINMNSGLRASDVFLKNYNAVVDLFIKYNVSEVRVFGSIFKNEDTSSSDVDLILNLPDNFTMFEYGKLKYELETVLSLSTDILTYSGLNAEVLKHFQKNSLSLFDFIEFKNNDTGQNEKSKFDKLKSNFNSVVWVINRIQSCCKNVTQEVYMTNETIQDAVSRNIQLLGQIISQIPVSELEQVEGVDVLTLKGCIALRDALFMNVDHNILWHTINLELEPLKQNIEEILKKG